MPAEISIRKASPDDAPIAARLIYEASFGYRDTIFGRGEEAERLAQQILSSAFRVPGHTQSYSYSFIAEDEDGICGMFSGFDNRERRFAERAVSRVARCWVRYLPPGRALHLMPFGLALLGTSAPIGEKDYYVDSVAVLPERRRQGIGRRLIAAAQDNAVSRGLERLALDVVADNNDAIAFYNRLGFKTESDRRFRRLQLYRISGIIRMILDIKEEHGNQEQD